MPADMSLSSASKRVRKAAAPFLEWLAEADDDDEEDSDLDDL